WSRSLRVNHLDWFGGSLCRERLRRQKFVDSVLNTLRTYPRIRGKHYFISVWNGIWSISVEILLGSDLLFESLMVEIDHWRLSHRGRNDSGTRFNLNNSLFRTF